MSGSDGIYSNTAASSGTAVNESLYVYNGTPYVAYEDSDNGGKATVMEYTGWSWQPVGSPDFSSGVADYESLYVYKRYALRGIYG